MFAYFELSSTSQTESVRRSKKSKPFSQKDDFIGSSSVKEKEMGEFHNEPLLPLRMKCIRSLTKDNKGLCSKVQCQQSNSCVVSTSASGMFPSPSASKLNVPMVEAKSDIKLKRKGVVASGKQLSEDSKKLHLGNSAPYSRHKEWAVSLKNSKDIPIRDDLERSFTVDKQHTIDSATKAGLPIIENSDTLLPTEESTECLHNGRSLVQVLPQPGSSLISQGRLLYMSNHVSVYTADAPGEEKVNFEHYLMRTMQDLEGSLGGCNIKSLWRERLKNRQKSCAASLPVPSYTTYKPTLTTVSQNVDVQTASVTMPPLTASTVILQCPQNPGKGIENPPNLSGNPWLPEESRIILSPPHKKELQAKHHHLLREKIEKRLKDGKKALRDKRREKITQRESIESQSDSSEQPSSFITHNGPECYVKPPAKSNRQLIKNAICHVCLAGDVNLSSKQRALTELETSSALHFFILFKHVISFKFRALYSYSEGKVCKIFGSGPQGVQECMIDQFYKYNCGSKEFSKIHSYSFSLSVDAFTLKQDAWALRRV
ncbi:Patronin [Geodia barretti]|nr:Patronin [Geodia barretti]